MKVTLNVAPHFPARKAADHKALTDAVYVGPTDVEEHKKLFAGTIDFVLREGKKTNKLVLDRSLAYLFNHDPDALFETIFQCLTKAYEGMATDVQGAIDTDSFSLAWFRDRYNELDTRAQTLVKYLEHIDRVSSRHLSGGAKSFLNVLRGLAMYVSTVNRKYTFKGGEKRLYEVLGNFIGEDGGDISEVVPYFSMFKYFEELKKLCLAGGVPLVTVEDSGEDDNFDFFSALGTNEVFVKSLVRNFNDTLKKLARCTKGTSEYRTLHGSLHSLCRLVNSMREKDLFFIGYHHMMFQRIQMSQYNHTVESEVVSELKCDDPTYTKIAYLADDMQESMVSLTVFEQLKLQPQKGSDYTKADIDKLNRKVFDGKVVRYYACPGVPESISVKLPPDLELMIRAYNKYYAIRYHGEKSISWEMNMGHSVIELDLGGVTYKMQVEIPQMVVLIALVEEGALDANQLAERTKISLKNLGRILSGLLKVKLVTRNHGDASSTDLKFRISEEFSNERTSFSLIGLTRRAEELMDEFAIGKEKLLQARMVRVAKHEPTRRFTVEELKSDASKDLMFTPQTAMVDDCVETLVEQGYLNEYDDDTYSYLPDYNRKDMCLQLVTALTANSGAFFTVDQALSAAFDKYNLLPTAQKVEEALAWLVETQHAEKADGKYRYKAGSGHKLEDDPSDDESDDSSDDSDDDADDDE